MQKSQGNLEIVTLKCNSCGANLDQIKAKQRCPYCNSTNIILPDISELKKEIIELLEVPSRGNKELKNISGLITHCLDIEDLDGANRHCDRALEIDPTLTNVWYVKADICYNQINFFNVWEFSKKVKQIISYKRKIPVVNSLYHEKFMNFGEGIFNNAYLLYKSISPIGDVGFILLQLEKAYEYLKIMEMANDLTFNKNKGEYLKKIVLELTANGNGSIAWIKLKSPWSEVKNSNIVGTVPSILPNPLNKVRELAYKIMQVDSSYKLPGLNLTKKSLGYILLGIGALIFIVVVGNL